MQSSAPIGIAGAGRLAQALGRLLRDAGESVVCLAGRDPARTRLAAAFAGAAPVSLAELPRRASRFLIAVSDQAIGEVAETLAAGRPAAAVALHTSGAAGPEALEPLRRAGAACGTLHPLQTVSSPEQGVAGLPGAFFAVSGDPGAACWAERVVALLGGAALRVPAAARPLYHAAAVMASNYIVALIDAAEGMLAEASGAEREAARRALAPLARAAVANALERGPAAALTGPVERGDAATVARHLDALAGSPQRAWLYRAAGLQALDLARRKGLADGPARELDALLWKGTSR